MKSKIIIGLLSLLGFAGMAYLTTIHYTEDRSFCDISQEVSCDVVTTSIYSEVFGVPLSLFGLFYFLAILLLLFSQKPKVFQTILLFTLFVLIPSFYFSLLELFVIQSICIICEGSKILMLLILLVSGIQAHQHEKLTLRLFAPVIIAGLAATGMSYFTHRSPPITKDYTVFAHCLKSKDITYYKSFRCSNCQRQELLFGKAIAILTTVECHPKGPNGNPQLCLAKKVNKTPTFLLEKNGVEVKRLEGLQTMDHLSEFSNCPLL